MARRNASTTEAPEAESTTPEAQAESTTPEAQAESTTETSTETPIDLTAFKGAVEQVLPEADDSTGVLPEAAVSTVNEQYRALDGQKPKNAARTWLEEQMLEAVGKLDAVLARSYSQLKAGLSAGGGSKAEKAPADPTAAYVQRQATLALASQIVARQRPEGDGVDEKVSELVTTSQEQVEAYQTWLDNEDEDKGDAPDVSPVVRAAFKAASGKGTGGGSKGVHSGPRGDIAKHVSSAFADQESGAFLTIAEIAKHQSPEYPSAPPSQGAVSARLFPKSGKCTIEGVEPVEKGAVDGKNPKGARKAA